MFGWFKKVVAWLDGPRLRDSYEDMLLAEAAAKAQEEIKPVTVEPLVLDTPVEEVAKVEEPVASLPPAVNDQITDSVTQAPAKPKRSRSKKGQFKGDDKATTEVNEAWEGGKAPAKKPAAPKKPRNKKK